MQQSGMLDRGDGIHLAWSQLDGHGPTLVFLPGLRSDMQGSKALDLLEFCAAREQAMLRLDYSGHGASDGAFESGSIGEWAEDAYKVISARTEGPLLLAGSSMGGWIGLLLSRRLGERLTGFIGIAAAPDFTERLMWQSMSPDEQRAILSKGELRVPSEYGEDMAITRKLIEDGRKNLVLESPLALPCPVRLLQGQRDPDVPWELALALAAHVQSPDVRTILIKDGDHRLSRPQDLALLRGVVGEFLGQDRF
jgi:pimeloyl-ACP methyl ester carboxylesterase